MRILPILALVAVSSPAEARTWVVPTDALTIAAALDSAASGDTVLVVCGTYAESGLVLGSGVTLRSILGDPICVTIDGQGAGRVLECSGAAPGTRLEGITVLGGDNAVRAPQFDATGGGLRCDSSTVDITDCVFRANTSRHGAGVACRDSDVMFLRCEFDQNTASDSSWSSGGGLWAQRGMPVLQECVFTGNTAFSIGLPGDGGGLFADSSHVVATDCVFLGNETGKGGGALYSFRGDVSEYTGCRFEGNTADAGGVAYVETSQPRFTDCEFVSNQASNGGAAFIALGSDASFTDCRFDSCVASPNVGGAVDIWSSAALLTRCLFRFNSATRGGALNANADSSPELVDCLLEGNTVTHFGGGIRATRNAFVTVTGCSFVKNSAGGGGAGLYGDLGAQTLVERSLVVSSPAGEAVGCADSATVTLICSDLFGNAGGDWVGCAAGQLGTAGNFTQDPIFCDALAGDHSLSAPTSPCLPANSPCGERVGSFGAGCSTGTHVEAGTVTARLTVRAVPNPAAGAARVLLHLPEGRHARVTLHDVAGRRLATLHDAPLAPGHHALPGSVPRSLPAGVYFLRLAAGAEVRSERLILLR